MPPDMAISMRHTKLKAEEAALLAGELNKPSWESRNEGIHERVTFEDTIWGFNLAGGVFYNTPLRVTHVKPDSRAEKAGIRPGDRLKRINDIDTSTLTIQQAHDIIVESGIHLKISVTSPDDEEDSYYCYEDPIVDGYDSEEERRLEEEKAKKRRVCARVSHYWSLQWPWVSRKRLIYRESNCFMVPSKYEDAHRSQYPPLPSARFTEDIVHFSADGNAENQENTKRIPSLWEVKEEARKAKKERLEKGYNSNDTTDVNEEVDETVSQKIEEKPNEKEVKEKRSLNSRRSTLTVERQETIDESKEEEETSRNETELNDDLNEAINEKINNEINELMNDVMNEEMNEIGNDQVNEENNEVDEEAEVENAADADNDEIDGDVNNDDMLNEVLGKGDSASRSEDDSNILDSILSDEGQNLENSESNNER